MFNKPRPKPYLWQVQPWYMTAKDKAWLEKALARDYHKLSLNAVLVEAANGFCQIWRCGQEEGIIVTEVVMFNGDNFLCTTYLAMSGYFKMLDEIEACLVAYAKEYGCKGILLEAARPGLQRLYEKRYKELTRKYIKEIN